MEYRLDSEDGVTATKFKLGQKVYVRTDPDQNMCIVTGFYIRDNGILYEVSKGMNQLAFTSLELSAEKNVVDFM